MKGGNKDDIDSSDILYHMWVLYADLRGVAQLHLLLADGQRHYRVAQVEVLYLIETIRTK